MREYKEDRGGSGKRIKEGVGRGSRMEWEEDREGSRKRIEEGVGRGSRR